MNAPLWPEEGVRRFRDAQARKLGLLPPKPRPPRVVEVPKPVKHFADKPCVALKHGMRCGTMFTPTHSRSLCCPGCK